MRESTLACVSEEEKDKELTERLSALEVFNRVFYQDSFFAQFLDDPTYVENYEVIKFMEILSEKSGLVFIWGHGLFMYNIDHVGMVKVEKLRHGKFSYNYF